ncbi:hypothetical protein Tasa_031_083 [Tanticharoenia sakaeratensis NBRC 103193]|uniref:Uncharacterized protein n=1 Tax=Tanticharoenia sakaeratensis NBRC 103193 TaxID=1231623 RepID=A0A0D6MN90_9PROT|nr:hypothetical protein Tasa_031_083 [Tanticharoenia sakaeratensis NBRC 103193]
MAGMPVCRGNGDDTVMQAKSLEVLNYRTPISVRTGPEAISWPVVPYPASGRAVGCDECDEKRGNCRQEQEHCAFREKVDGLRKKRSEKRSHHGLGPWFSICGV